MMLLYHGSSVIVETPDLLHSRGALDFGKGFYTTPIKEQAESWCRRFGQKGQSGVLSTYEFDERKIQTLNAKVFEFYDTEWLGFVLSCRRKLDKTDYELVIGGIANDIVFNTVELYFDDLIDKKEALKRLKYEKPNIQYCFRTKRAIEMLHFKGSEQIC